ncbi:hypothetical protein [Flavobacterium adhaerens]|uniref:hypothetical protein n=1 Tax=Flavobacterium adhaerens TaxID=3149043 RepID=UPI0032B34BEF
MKRIFGILCCTIAFSACDDGDLIVDTINFDEVSTSTCTENNLLFKLKDSESLILDVPEDTFEDDVTETGEPITLNINSTNRVVYNFYDGQVSSDNICDLIPPATPNINTQWTAASGVIEITTEAVKTADEDDGSTRITGYKNTIVFRNITFAKGDGTTQFYDVFSFGDYLRTITPLELDFEQLLLQCDSGLIYEFNDSESLTLDIDPNLIKNEVTPLDQPRKGTIGLENNRLVYHTYENGIVTEDYFCQTTDPALPSVAQEWLGRVGGEIEVTTTTSGNAFTHTIVLKNVTLEKGNSNFQLGTSYKYGELQTISN